MQLVGVSQDEASDSRAFANQYGIAFPLLTDRDRGTSRAYTGIDGADNTIPGIVIIRRDGTIAFRQIAQEKDDRLDSAQLLAIIDRTLERSGGSARTGYQVLERVQLGVVGGAAIASSATPTLHARIALPIGRYVLAGLLAGTQKSRANFDGSAFAGLRVPFLGDTAAVHVLATGGIALGDADLGRGHIGGRTELWVALSPTWGLHLDAGVRGHLLDSPELTVTFGISRLIER